jgi:hypothetical protein
MGKSIVARTFKVDARRAQDLKMLAERAKTQKELKSYVASGKFGTSFTDKYGYVGKVYQEYQVIDPGNPGKPHSGIRGKLGMKKGYRKAQYLLASDDMEPFVHEQAPGKYLYGKEVKSFSRHVMKPSANRSY